MRRRFTWMEMDKNVRVVDRILGGLVEAFSFHLPAMAFILRKNV